MQKRPTVTILLALFLIFAVNTVPAGPQRRAKGKGQRTRPLPAKRTTKSPSPKQQLPVGAATAALQQSLREVIERQEFTTALVGVHIVKTASGEVLFQHEAGKMLMPASNMKVYTTAAALAYLGPDYRLRTSVLANTRPDESGNIKGDLVLYGRGDPSLASSFVEPAQPFEKLAAQLATAGVKQIEGDLVADESFLRGSPLAPGWEWTDLQWPFGAEVSALTCYDNSVMISVTPGEKVGDPAIITFTPDVGYMSADNRVVTVKARTARDIGLKRGLSDNKVSVWGEIPVGDSPFQARLAVHRPAAYAGAIFKAELAKAGIIVKGTVKVADASEVSQVAPADLERLTELAAIDSPPLSELVRVVNKFSHNLFAELVLRTLGRVKGKPELDSDAAGLTLINDLLTAAGIKTVTPLKLRDGSGLSRRTLLSAEATTQLLNYMARQPVAQVFKDSLPIAAVDGTLTRRMFGTPAANNVQAKTGTLDGTSSLSGYVTTAAGETLSFSIIINHYTDEVRKAIMAQNEICELLAGFQEKLEFEAKAADATETQKP